MTWRTLVVSVLTTLLFSLGAGAAASTHPLLALKTRGANSQNPATSLAWAIPRSAVGRQFAWLLAAADDLPIPASVVRRHFDAKFLRAVNPAALNRAIESVGVFGAWRIVTLDASTSADFLLADVVTRGARIGVEIGVDDSGLIGLLYFQPSPALPRSPSTWTAVDRELSSLAPHVGFEAATIDREGGCNVRNAVSPGVQRPLGSMFKLFVLGAVANAVKTGKLRWSAAVPLTSSERSLPSGLLQVDPDGSRFTVGRLAQQMIASSDNTAADMLIALVGRRAVESQVARWTAGVAANSPFLTPREFFTLKYDRYPVLANRYLSLGPLGRLGYLDSFIDRIPLSRLSPTATALAAPRDIDSIEWFGSPSAICRSFAELHSLSRAKNFAPVGAALSLNDGGVALPRAQWSTIWFKGGSEAGVLSLGYLAEQPNGNTTVVVLELSNAHASLAETVALQALAVVRGAFSLLTVKR